MPTLILPRLYAIVDAETLAARGVSLSSFVQELRDAGVTLLQYRDKTGTQEQILHNAALIRQVFHGTDATLVMNDSPELARLAGWGAVHVGQGDLAISEARAVLPHGIVGCSTHSARQVIEADAAGADYIAIGPVFPTATKRDPDPVVGLEGVRQARPLTSKPLVAIGGIDADNAASVIGAGADSVAVIGALLRPGVAVSQTVGIFTRSMPALAR